MNPPCPFFLAFLKTCEANRHPLRQVRMAWRIRRRSQKDELSCCSSFSRAHNENSSTIDSIIFGSMEWATNEWKFIKHPNYANGPYLYPSCVISTLKPNGQHLITHLQGLSNQTRVFAEAHIQYFIFGSL